MSRIARVPLDSGTHAGSHVPVPVLRSMMISAAEASLNPIVRAFFSSNLSVTIECIMQGENRVECHEVSKLGFI